MANRGRRDIHPLRRALPFDEWPAPDRVLWTEGIHNGGVFENSGRGAHWQPKTRRGYQFAYGRWLRFLVHHTPQTLRNDPPERLTKNLILTYVEFLQSQQLNPTTIWGYLSQLHNVAYRLMPSQSWDHLQTVVNRLHLIVNPRPYLEAQLIPVQDLYHCGLKIIDQAESDKPRRPSCISADYRDGLMIALLASMPVRLGNFSAIEICRHLVNSTEGYLILFPRDEVKNRQDIEAEVYDPLVPIIDRYVNVHRPQLLKSEATSKLWISKAGQHMKDHHVSKRIVKVTTRELGKPISPHLFRHCAATSIAEASPELARIIRPLLAHTTTQTSERYYNRASVLSASQRHITAIEELRSSLSEMAFDEVA